MKNNSQYIAPILCICISIGLFVFIINPAIARSKSLKTNLVELKDSQEKINTVVDTYDSLKKKFESITSEQISTLDKALPSNVNNVRLILELERIANTYAMGFKDVKVELVDKEQASMGKPIEKNLSAVKIELTLVGSYEGYLKFLADTEKSLRVLSIKAVDFKIIRATTAKEKDQYEFKLSLETYWFTYSSDTKPTTSTPTPTQSVVEETL